MRAKIYLVIKVILAIIISTLLVAATILGLLALFWITLFNWTIRILSDNSGVE